YERGEVGHHLQQWGHARMFTAFGHNTTPLGKAALRAEYPRLELPADADLLTGREHRDAYLLPLSQVPWLAEHLSLGTEVLRLGRAGFLGDEGAGDPRRAKAPFRLLVRDAGGAERYEQAAVILDCTGTYAHPRWLGVDGIPAPGE